MYAADVEFEYSVGDRTYRRRKVSVASLGSTMRSVAELAAGRYVVGRQVTVYYDPEKPADSILERGDAAGWGWLLVIVGVVILAGGLLWPLVVEA